MVRLASIFIGLSVLSRGAFVACDAFLNFYEASSVSESTTNLTARDCAKGIRKGSIIIPQDTCVWGNYYLVNNFKVTSLPYCNNRQQPVLQVYDSTSCTGKPTFTSNEKDATGLLDRCYFGSSPMQWSMIFRCEDMESQFVSVRNFRQALPPKASTNRTEIVANLPPAVAVVLPHTSYDCTIWKPKPPTFLPTDTCLKLTSYRAIFIQQPAICENGATAQAYMYKDSTCSQPLRKVGLEASSLMPYYDTIDKKCHQIDEAESIAFLCEATKDTSGLRKLEDLPPHEFKDVTPLKILEPYDEPEEKEPEEENPTKKPTGAVFLPHDRTNCRDEHFYPLVVRPVDTCVPTSKWMSLEIITPAVCRNGTSALWATYNNPYCQTRGLTSFGELPTKYRKSCPDTEEIMGIAFVCDGVTPLKGGSENGGGGGGGGGSGGSAWGLIKFLLIVFGVLMLMALLTLLSCVLRGARMMQQVNDVMERVFGRRDGAIRL